MFTTLQITPNKQITCPAGSALYWSRVLMFRAGVKSVSFTDGRPRLPYLGHIALPSDRLAAEWLADNHGGR